MSSLTRWVGGFLKSGGGGGGGAGFNGNGRGEEEEEKEEEEEDVFNRLSISRCYEVRTARRRAAVSHGIELLMDTAKSIHVCCVCCVR